VSDVPGIRADAVTRFFHARVPGAGGPLAFRLLSGGRSNLTYLVTDADGHEWVLRRPPLGHVLATAHDMAREYRVLAALAPTDVPVATPVALCEDATVNDAPFYVMAHRPGVVVHDTLPPGFADAPADRARIGEALVDTLVRLHAVDFRAVGLADFGRPDGYLERQVRRWATQWAGNKTSELPIVDDLLARLARAVPPSPAPTIVHGDYRLGNVCLAPDDPGRIVAVFDWEMATLGDPLADLGYLLVYWPEAGDPPAAPGFSTATALPGFPTRAELVARYAARSGRTVAAIDFYRVLALTKLAVISEGIYKRHVIGKGIDDAPALRVTADLARRALAIAGASADPRLRRATS
jgi:aminoglycoside phosphotransferase (APT) family kinase protein